MKALEISIALIGSAIKDAQRENARLARALTNARDVAGARLKSGVRQDTARALGRRVANTWRYKAFPKGRVSLRAAAWLESKAPEIVQGHRGALIRARRKTYIAIPTDWAQTIILHRGRRVRSPKDFPTNRFGPLRFVPGRRGRNAMLVVEGLSSRRTKTGKLSYRRAGKRARAKGQAERKVAFTLVRAVRLPRRINPDRQFVIARRLFDRAAARNILNTP